MKAIRFFTTALLMMFFAHCSDTDSSEFEKASGISLPAGSKQLDSHDDGTFVKTNAYAINSQLLKELVAEHSFEKLDKMNLPQFWGINNIEEKPDFTNLDSFYFKTGRKDSLSWIYIADLKSDRLWTEIKYPGKPAY